MEIKKSHQANLEASRPQRFLIGLLVALLLFFMALEYAPTPDDPLDDPDLMDRLDAELELPPMLQTENELTLAPKAEPKPENRIVVVDEVETADELTPDEEALESDIDDDMEFIEGDVEMEAPPPPDDEVVSFRVVQEMPQFPGGPVEFMKWLTRNLKYPPSVQQQQVQGRVVAQFIIEKDGAVTNVSILSALHPQCDNEVLRVLRMMPRWTAGIDQGEPCRTLVCIPVVFKL